MKIPHGLWSNASECLLCKIFCSITMQPGTLSSCTKNPVVPLVNQMERTFHWKAFGKNEYLKWNSSFLVTAEMMGKSSTSVASH